MTSQAQTNSNRDNAKNSTGPKTPDGKGIASQNAIKNGFFAKNDVILGEDPAAYEQHRQDIYDEFAPMTPTESVLTQRIASLTWRLMRADRLQTTTINTLVTEHYADPPYSTRQLLGYPSRAESYPGPAISEPELVLGTIIQDAFRHSRVLERLSKYERRIENSLLKTIRLIQQLQQNRIKAAAAQEKRDWAYLRQEDEYRQRIRNEPNPDAAGGPDSATLNVLQECELRKMQNKPNPYPRAEHEPNPRTGTACRAPNAQNEPNSKLTSISETTYNRSRREKATLAEG